MEVKIIHNDITITYDGLISLERNGEKISAFPEDFFDKVFNLDKEEMIEKEYSKLHNKIFEHRNVDNLPIHPDRILKEAKIKKTHNAYKGMLVAYHLRGPEGFWNFVKSKYGIKKELFVVTIKINDPVKKKTYPITIDIPTGKRTAEKYMIIRTELSKHLTEKQLVWNIIDLQKEGLRKWRKDGEVHLDTFYMEASYHEIHQVLNYK